MKALWGATAGLALMVVGCGESVRHAPAGEVDGSGGGAGQGGAGQLLLLDGYGLPFADMPVLVDDTVITTDDNGIAPLPDVGERYDVSVVSLGRAYVFVGLKTRAPVVRLPGSSNGKNISSMSLTIARPELRSDQEFFYSAGFAGVAPDQQFFGTGTDEAGIDLFGYWAGTSPVTFSAEAFVVDVEPDTRAPLAFTGYALENWSIAPDAELAWTPALAAPPFGSATIHLELDLPDGASVDSYTTTAFEPSGREGSLGRLDRPVSSDVLVPDVPDTAYRIDVGTSADGFNGFTARAEDVHAGDSVTLDAHAAPLQLAPDDGAVVTADTEFSWTVDDGAIYQLVVSALNDDGTNHLTVITTTEPSARLPDLAVLGSPFPAGKPLSWQLFSLEGVASLDGFAADGRYGSSGVTRIRKATGAP